MLAQHLSGTGFDSLQLNEESRISFWCVSFLRFLEER